MWSQIFCIIVSWSKLYLIFCNCVVDSGCRSTHPHVFMLCCSSVVYTHRFLISIPVNYPWIRRLNNSFCYAYTSSSRDIGLLIILISRNNPTLTTTTQVEGEWGHPTLPRSSLQITRYYRITNKEYHKFVSLPPNKTTLRSVPELGACYFPSNLHILLDLSYLLNQPC